MTAPNVLRVSDLTPAQAALVRALIGQRKAGPDDQRPGPAKENDDGVRRVPPAA